MKSVFVLAPNENWIVDRFVKEWNDGNIDMSMSNVNGAEVIWILADWCWTKIPYHLLQSKRVITTIHHIVPEKFGKNERHDFMERDRVTTCYHVYNQQVMDFVRPLTDKSIHLIPYWFDQEAFQPSMLSKHDLRLKYGLPLDAFLVGSAQRDTEGTSIATGIFLPKLEKGADLFCNAIEKLKSTNPNVHVLLGGWRRQYVIQRLIAMKVPYSYFELPRQEKLNELLQCLDLYIVASRVEGGPQSILECGSLGVPVVSTPVGIASQCLPTVAINEDVTLATPTIPVVPDHMKLPYGFEPYRRLINSL